MIGFKIDITYGYPDVIFIIYFDNGKKITIRYDTKLYNDMKAMNGQDAEELVKEVAETLAEIFDEKKSIPL